MPPAATSTHPVPRAYHALAGAFVAWCAWLAMRRPDAYGAAMQEDRLVEWMTVFVFAAAGVTLLVRAGRGRRWFDLLVALFLLFVAGEEMSWGQRLFGLTPPAYFLAHNTQQEMNVHNFANLFGSPKGPFTLVLAGYAILLPLAAAFPAGRRLLARIGATAPPPAVIPWFVAAIVLFVWYPFRFTGEWTELLAGSAFLMSVGLPTTGLLVLAPASLVAAFALQTRSARGHADPARVACASAELAALGDVVGRDLSAAGSLHKRVWTLVEDGRVPAGELRARLRAVPCADPSADARRQYMVDPWGTAYWVRVVRLGARREVSVYSFGPNRRRDVDAEGRPAGDDLIER